MRLPHGRRIGFLHDNKEMIPVEYYFFAFLIIGMITGVTSMMMQKMMTTNAIGLLAGLNMVPIFALLIR